MRFSDLTDQERNSLIKEFVSLRVDTHARASKAQKQIAAYFIAAGFCVFGCLRAIALGPAMPAAMLLFLFALGCAYFFGTAWTKFTSHNVTVSAGERAYLVLVFERLARDGVEFSTEEIVSFLRFAPDRPL